MSTIGTMAVVVSARNNMANGLRGAERDINRFGKRVQGTLAGATTMPPIIMSGFKGFAALGAGMGIMAQVRNMEKFDQAMTNSLAITKDVSPQIRKEMEMTARRVANHTKFAADEIAGAYYHILSAGLDTAQAMKALLAFKMCWSRPTTRPPAALSNSPQP